MKELRLLRQHLSGEAANIEKLIYDPFGFDPNDREREPDLEAMFARQREAAVNTCLAVEAALSFLICHHAGTEMDAEAVIARKLALMQIDHTRKYMRLPQNPKLPEVYRRFGARIDRMSLMGAELIVSAVDLYELPSKLADLRERAEAHERRRKLKLEARRQRAALEAVSKPLTAPVKRSRKKYKHEARPRCEKCGKRPQASGKLCAPCASWEARR